MARAAIECCSRGATARSLGFTNSRTPLSSNNTAAHIARGYRLEVIRIWDWLSHGCVRVGSISTKTHDLAAGTLLAKHLADGCAQEAPKAGQKLGSSLLVWQSPPFC